MDDMIKPGQYNSICDVTGILVGNAEDQTALCGVTVIVPDRRVVAAVDVRGGAPGTRETDLLNPVNSVDSIDAIVLSGGSTYGLEAASAVTRWLAERRRGLSVGNVILPIVPSAIIFDFPINGKRDWFAATPFDHLGRTACEQAAKDFGLGNVGAGLGATAGRLKGGLGTASYVTEEDWEVGAIMVVNAFGEVVVPDTNCFYAGSLEQEDEFGGKGPARLDPAQVDYSISSELRANTTIGVVATNIKLSKVQAFRMAIMAQDGLARAVRPVHTPFDGDIVFVISTSEKDLQDPTDKNLMRLGNLAADCVARAVARGVYCADTLGEFTGYKDLRN